MNGAQILPDRDSVTLVDALEACANTLRDHPGYAADTTFAAIWQWLARQEAALEIAAAALAKARGEVA